ncbi:MAG TPA: homocysteine S-methyltransferase family protein [Nitrososphaeraceae archaeon]|jgi:5-methyltetrahydrofolate--homocysteine methyltransferase|nr:homocysteine S-methyltransferase family protein [Nitrososphaeraceae archaeon]
MPLSLTEAIREHIILFDGGMGTEIQKLNPQPQDFPGGNDGFNDGLNLTKPEWIKKIHRDYLMAGADCIETNSFGSNLFKLKEYGYGLKTVEINRGAAELARGVCNEFKDRYRYVIGSVGPTGFLPSSEDQDLGKLSPQQIIDGFLPQFEGLLLGGVDSLLIETSQDILEVKLAIEACHLAMQKVGRKVPLIGNVTLDKYGKMLLGTDVQAAYTTVCDMGIDIFGLNCSTGPDEMLPSIRWLDEQHGLPILVVPNAGMPQNIGGKAVYKMTPEDMALKMQEFIKQYSRIRIIGGCCGTTPLHINNLREMLEDQGFTSPND